MNVGALVVIALGVILAIAGFRNSWKQILADLHVPQSVIQSFDPGTTGLPFFTPSGTSTSGPTTPPASAPGGSFTDFGSSFNTSAPSGTYQNMAFNDAVSAGINPNVFVRQINQESGFDPNALSSAGAQGIAQFMPGTAAGLGINPWNPQQALQGAATLMSNYVQEYGSETAALAAYNAGPGTVQGAKLQAMQNGGSFVNYLPLETQNYIQNILGGGNG